jgi:hypothetical protein
LVKKKYYEYRSFKSLEISATPYNKGREEGEEGGREEVGKWERRGRAD